MALPSPTITWGASACRISPLGSGFLAKTHAEEKPCPAFELNVLQAIEDVTPQVQGAAKAGATVAEAGQEQREMMARLEGDCARKSGLRCEIVTLYAGGLYQLYKYKRYTDVRLVFVPEERIAFFGGDPDNFEFPRYDLDIAFFRVYENGRPAHLKDYLKFSHGGVKDGDLVFVSGNPGRTERLLTVAQLDFLRDVQTPFTLDVFTQRYQALKTFAAQSTENARIAADDVFGYENALKAFKGRYAGLMDKPLMDEKAKREAALRTAVDRDPKMKSEYGAAWDAVAKAVEKQAQLFPSYYFVESLGGFAGAESHFARQLVRVSAERQKPEQQRLREYGPARLPSLEQQLFSTAPVYDVAAVDAGKAWPRECRGPAGAWRTHSGSGREGSDREYKTERRRLSQTSLRGRVAGRGAERGPADRADA
jgi:hypothetical protein